VYHNLAELGLLCPKYDDTSSEQLKIATDLGYLHELFVLRRDEECLSVVRNMESSVLIHLPGSRTRLNVCTRSLFTFHEDISAMLQFCFLNFYFHILQFYRTEIKSYISLFHKLKKYLDL
jgi:hypothetical protein